MILINLSIKYINKLFKLFINLFSKLEFYLLYQILILLIYFFIILFFISYSNMIL
jgi:hypothetical protein